MIRALFLSIGQLGDRRILWVFMKSLVLTLVLLSAFGAATWYGLSRALAYWQLGTAIEQATGILAGLLVLFMAGVLFRAIALLVIGIFADEVVMAVEAKHYPEALAQARAVPLRRSIAMGFGSLARFVLINLLLLPAYLIFVVTGVGPAILFFVVNGWLLGRDLGDMVAARHMHAAELKGWRGSTALSRFVLGLIGTGLFVVPVVNLAAPVIMAAMATHWFHAGRKTK